MFRGACNLQRSIFRRFQNPPDFGRSHFGAFSFAVRAVCPVAFGTILATSGCHFWSTQYGAGEGSDNQNAILI